MGFKERLVQLRKEKELNQEQFAKVIGYTRTTISAWEVGRNEPSNADTVKIADFFGVSTDYLLGKSDIRNPEELKKVPFANAGGLDTKGLDTEDLVELQKQIDYIKRLKKGKKK